MKRRLNISSLLNKDDEELEKTQEKIITHRREKCRKRIAREIERRERHWERSKHFILDVKINEELEREKHTNKNYYTEEKWKENKRYKEKQQKKNE